VITKELAARVLKGDRTALAKAITKIENRERGAGELLAQATRRAGKSFIVGITGPPGTGKSTLVDRLISSYRKKGFRLGVIAVDPSSPITGGALLGDRIRMTDFATDGKVFMRSMASRGWSGGLSAAVTDAIRMIEVWGADVIFVETVGIGQADVEITRIAHAVVVVLMPSMGDDVQVSKAGLLEVGDIYAVNKSDLEGAGQIALYLLAMVRSSKEKRQVVKVSALKGEGMDQLMTALEALRAKFAGREGREVRLKSVRGMMLEVAKYRVLSRFEAGVDAELIGKLAEQVADGKIGFEQAVEKLSETALLR
jgi:LAO/AO transport system kinase